MAIEQLCFDYAALDEPTRCFVQEKAQSIHARLKRTAEDIIAIGQDLIEVKAQLEKINGGKAGLFQSWRQSNFDLSQRTVERFMHLAERFGESPIAKLAGTLTVLQELDNSEDIIIEMVETQQIPATIPAIREAKRELQQESIAPRQFDEEYTKEEPYEQTEQDRYMTAVDMGTTDYYYDDLRRDAFRRDEEEREAKRQQARERLANLRTQGVILPAGKYSCLIVDPPWPMQKIERDVRPNQVEFDYPTMSEDELKVFPLPDWTADDCHLYLWTTQKHLPLALRLAEHWGFKYQCLMTWVKNVGFTPFSWMYSTEHVLFCTKGSLPLLALGKRLDFSAKVREHSRKPDEFYDLVRDVSPGPRLDVFSREKRDGFEQYGNEVEKYVSQ